MRRGSVAPIDQQAERFADMLSRIANLERVASHISGISGAQPGLISGLLNGAMQVAQRGTTFALPNGTRTYTLDRWEGLRAATGATISQQAGPSPFNKVLRIQRDSGGTSTVDIKVAQSIESIESTRFQGLRVTLAFYARKGANLSTANGAVNVSVSVGTGTDQSHLATVTGQTFPADIAVPLTTDLARHSVTLTVPANATTIGVIFTLSPTGTAGANDWVDLTGVQFEAGPAPSPFEFIPFDFDLWRCRRFYWRHAGSASGTTPFGAGVAVSTTSAHALVVFPNRMRSAPAIGVSANTDVAVRTSATTVATAIALDDPGLDRTAVNVTVAAGLTAGHGAVVRLITSATAWVAFTAEL